MKLLLFIRVVIFQKVKNNDYNDTGLRVNFSTCHFGNFPNGCCVYNFCKYIFAFFNILNVC